MKTLDGSSYHCPALVHGGWEEEGTKQTHTYAHRATITLPRADAEIHVRVHRVPLPCNN